MSVTVRRHEPGKDLKTFLQVPYEIYGDDPAWVAPLKMEVAERLTPRKNPFFDHAGVALFTAHRDGRLCGRISAQVDHEHLRVHDAGRARTVPDRDGSLRRGRCRRHRDRVRGGLSEVVDEPADGVVSDLASRAGARAADWAR
jgi:hypothetical protein